MRIRPLKGKVIVKSKQYEGKLEVVSDDKPYEGEVIAVAEGSSVSVGDMVLFSQYAPMEFEVDGVKILILDEEDILAKR